MEPRIHYEKFASEALRAIHGLERYVRATGLGEKLLELVRMRASQMNGCAYCLDMHSKDARAAGETEQRLYALNAWREAPFYTARERAALAWTESLTLVAQTHVPDGVYEEVRKEFTDAEMLDLTYAVMAINAWNRMAIAMRAVPGSTSRRRKRPLSQRKSESGAETAPTLWRHL
jgi:AhpD family alkylhydroperoxidase